MTQGREHLPRWPIPGFYGSADAVQEMGTVAAPLLAGFAITVATLVVTSANSLRWPGACLVAAVTASVMLLVSVQLTFWARQALVTPAVVREWWDDVDTVDGRAARVREMGGFVRVHRWYAAGARHAYDLGIALLLLAVTLLLLPTDHARQPALRWAAVGVSALATLSEALWTLIKLQGAESPPLLRRLRSWLIRNPADYMEER